MAYLTELESEPTAAKTKRNISSITGTARKVGHGAHVMVPKEWVGKECHVIPVEIFEQEALDQLLKGHRFGIRRRGRRR